MSIIFSCVIPCSKRDYDSQNLKDLLASIRSQDFPQEQIETIIVTEGDSEQAKGIGIRRAKGIYCVMFCADNVITYPTFFWSIKNCMEKGMTGVYFKHYAYKKEDNSLNRYFSLIGGNDVISFYLGKNDRRPYWEYSKNELCSTLYFHDKVPSLGCNGFAFNKQLLLKYVDLDHYYPMDAAQDLIDAGLGVWARIGDAGTWHRTSDNLFTFLKKRYKYARDLYSDRADRRWKIIDTACDKWLLCWFILSVLTVVPCLFISLRGYLKIRDLSWFWHWPVCLGFLITYGLLVCRNLLKHQLSFRHWQGVVNLPTASKA